MNAEVSLKNIINNHKKNILKELPNNEKKLYSLYDNITSTPIHQTDIDILKPAMATIQQ